MILNPAGHAIDSVKPYIYVRLMAMLSKHFQASYSVGNPGLGGTVGRFLCWSSLSGGSGIRSSSSGVSRSDQEGWVGGMRPKVPNCVCWTWSHYTTASKLLTITLVRNQLKHKIQPTLLCNLSRILLETA